MLKNIYKKNNCNIDSKNIVYKRKNILKILITLSLFLIISSNGKSYGAEGTLRMQINNGVAWTNINISQSYEACENLNKSTSTLGTTLLQAHLTTDQDWSAMAIFSVSQYGASTRNDPSTTNGNASGIYNVSKNKTQTTGLASKANVNSTEYLYGLYNEDGSTKKYIKTWNIDDRESNDYVGFKLAERNLWMDGFMEILGR